MLNPVLRVRTAENAARYRVEPYALAGDVYSCAPWAGRGGWSWYTGAAAWTWRLGIEAILGLRSEDGELVIDPCLPPGWSGFEAWVRRGKRHVHVVVENVSTLRATGAPVITLDGVGVDSNRVRLDPSTPGTHEVVVRLEGGKRPERRAPVASGVRHLGARTPGSVEGDL
jgi:cyclic beta-1,2-glucan synthetase